MKRRLAILIFCGMAALAHPLGNFSIGQYAGFLLRPDGITVTYAVDFAEIPSMKLEERWKAGESTDQVMREWVKNLRFRSRGQTIEPFHESTSPFPGIGAGGMSTMLIVATLKLPGDLTELEYEDPNFPGRAGWKEIAVRAEGLQLTESSHAPGKDLSRALTNYPLDLPTVPHDLRARFVFGGTGDAPTRVIPLAQPPVSQADSRRAEDFSELGRADLLSRLMRQGELPFRLLLTALGIAFAMGAFHALEPGHGKTLVAAYLVGSRGTWQHAVYLGAITTFTHTFTVFVMGLVVLAASRSIPVEQIFPYLSVASALTIVVFGGWLLWKRIEVFRKHNHSYGGHHHSHDHAHTHDHSPPGKVTFGSLLALGVSGGLVPCPASLVLLLGAMALGRLPLGLGLLVAFSLGMAGVLTGIGVLVVYAKRWLPESAGESHGFHYMAIASAAIMTIIGIGLTVVALRQFGVPLGS